LRSGLAGALSRRARREKGGDRERERTRKRTREVEALSSVETDGTEKKKPKKSSVAFPTLPLFCI
jgi:hypothetical protein